MKRRLSVTNFSSQNNLPTFRLNAPVIIRVKVMTTGAFSWNVGKLLKITFSAFMQKPTEKPMKKKNFFYFRNKCKVESTYMYVDNQPGFSVVTLPLLVCKVYKCCARSPYASWAKTTSCFLFPSQWGRIMATQVVYTPPQPGATCYPQAAPVVFVSLVHKYVVHLYSRLSRSLTQ